MGGGIVLGFGTKGKIVQKQKLLIYGGLLYFSTGKKIAIFGQRSNPLNTHEAARFYRQSTYFYTG